jgi:hypothetical protein
VPIGGVIEFGKYILFKLQGEAVSEESCTNGREPTNAFTVMMEARSAKSVPESRGSGNQVNRKKNLFNDLCSMLEKKGLGWRKNSVTVLGVPFMSALTNSLWILDPHRETLKKRSCHIPDFFDSFEGYNCPYSHHHLAKKLSKDVLAHEASLLFNFLQQVSLVLDKR